MIKKSFAKQIAGYVALVVLGMLLSASLTGHASERLASPQDTSPASQDIAAGVQHISSPASPTSETWVTCTPVVVGVIGTNRIHVRCAEAYGGIDFFAVPTDDPAHTARMLSVLSTAQVAGRTLNLLYDPADTSALPPGCAESNCRLLEGAEFGQ